MRDFFFFGRGGRQRETEGDRGRQNETEQEGGGRERQKEAEGGRRRRGKGTRGKRIYRAGRKKVFPGTRPKNTCEKLEKRE
jgi:hypothetical protein